MVSARKTESYYMKFSSELILEIGETYETRGHGPNRKDTVKKRTIIRRFPNTQYEFQDDQGDVYTMYGNFYPNGPSRHDLVRKVNQ